MSEEHKDIAGKILEALKADNFLGFVSDISPLDQENWDLTCGMLVSLNNRGEIDLISEFEKLENKPDSPGDFFSAKHILEKTLPDINASTQQVITCVKHVISEAGQDLSAGLLIQPLTEFCETTPSRVDEGLDFILSEPELYANLLPPILIAGANIDIGKYLRLAIDYTSHENVALRSNAVFTLGRIQFLSESEYPRRAIDCLAAVTEIEVVDQVLGNIVWTVCSIVIADNVQIDKGVDILLSALSKGDEITLYFASQVFGYQTKKLPEQLLDALLPALIDVNPEHAGTLRNIGYGVSSLLKREDPGKGIVFLENLLLNHQGELTIESLDHVVHDIINQDVSLLNKLLTRWFLRAEHILYDSIRAIVNSTHLKELHLGVDPVELPSEKSIQHIFVAHKCIGFLFLQPLSCASFLLSLMENSQDEEVLHVLGMLLFDPVLLNYSGKPYEYLKAKQNAFSEPVNLEIQKSINAIDGYLEGLRSVPDIPEMYPTQEQREIKRRSFGRQIAESYKETQKGSIFNTICSKSIILYGRSSIMHVYDGDGKSHRTEIPMQQHSVSIEVPRLPDIDPVGFDFNMCVFRMESF